MSTRHATTRTGGFPIGFRSLGPRWRENLEQVISFARNERFAGVDVGPLAPEDLKRIIDAGLRIGSIDLPQPWSDLASPDVGKRKAGADRCAAYVQSAVQFGCRNFFVVVFPEDAAGNRAENFRLAVDGYSRLCEAIAPLGARIVIEGYPGGPPHYHALACTPEGYRAIIRETPGQVIGVNFDPSHLLRMGIDPVRFLGEFAPHVYHVHAKDTEILDDDVYELGTLQTATFAKPHPYGRFAWRYTIPGHGVSRWGKLFRQLTDAGYEGMVSIELEDENFHNTDELEMRGFTASRDFLVHV